MNANSLPWFNENVCESAGGEIGGISWRRTDVKRVGFEEAEQSNADKAIRRVSEGAREAQQPNNGESRHAGRI